MITVSVPPQDPRLVYRIVGFLEYGKVLEFLGKFVEAATSEELKVADDIVKDREAFIIYVNLSRHIEGPSSLSEPRRAREDDSARHGLDWVLALARVELGAMLAGFTSHSSPFQAVAPGTLRIQSTRIPPIDTEAFRELLTDGMRMHYWSLRNGHAVQNYYTYGVPENHLLTYGRRTVVARSFLKAARAYSQDKWSSRQLTEMNQWENYIKKAQITLLYCLSEKVGQEKRLTTVTARKFTGSRLAKAYVGSKLGISTKDRQEFKVTSNRDFPKLSDFLRLIDPTLKFCQCR